MHYGAKHGWVHKNNSLSFTKSKLSTSFRYPFQPNFSTQSSFQTCGFKFTVKLWPISLQFFSCFTYFPLEDNISKSNCLFVAFLVFKKWHFYADNLSRLLLGLKFNSLMSSHFGTLWSHCGMTICYGMIE